MGIWPSEGPNLENRDESNLNQHLKCVSIL